MPVRRPGINARSIRFLFRRFRTTTGKRIAGIGIRIVLSLLAVPTGDLSAKAVSTEARTLSVLTSNFAGSPPEIQKKVLREIGILRNPEAPPFLAAVAIEEGYENDVRREALKAMLATDGARYRPVAKPLSVTLIETGGVIAALVEIGDPRFAGVFIERGSKGELSERDLRAAVTLALDFWGGERESGPAFRRWRDSKASAQLAEIASESAGLRKRSAVAALGWVRDQTSTQALIRLLDSEEIAVAACAIEGLGNEGPDASPALGRFLMKSGSAELRRRAIESLVRIGTSASKRALRAYLPKASAEERGLITIPL